MLKKVFSIWITLSLVVAFFELFFVNEIDPYVVSILVYSGINIILAVSLNLINGFTGQFSMGHAGFMAVGAYSASMFSLYLKSSSPAIFDSSLTAIPAFILILLCGGSCAGLTGYLVGLPTLRLRGDYLAIVTLGFSEIIRVVLLSMDQVGGARGLTNIPSITNFCWVYLIAIFTIFFIVRLLKTPNGRELLAVREDEIAAQSVGVNTTRAKVRAFTFGAFFAGVAGALFAHYLRFISPASFDVAKSFEVIIMVVLGGMGSISGSVFAAVFLTIVRELLRPLQQITGTDYRMVIYSLLLIGLMLTRPNGIFGTREIFDYLPQKIKKIFRKEASKPGNL